MSSQSENECFIHNIDHSKSNGMHWTCSFPKNRESYYFDPFGIQPPLEILNYCKEPIMFSFFKIQKPNEVICVHYCIYVLHSQSNGDKFDDVMHEFNNYSCYLKMAVLPFCLY